MSVLKKGKEEANLNNGIGVANSMLGRVKHRASENPRMAAKPYPFTSKTIEIGHGFLEPGDRGPERSLDESELDQEKDANARPRPKEPSNESNLYYGSTSAPMHRRGLHG